jgi:hypothetical protein
MSDDVEIRIVNESYAHTFQDAVNRILSEGGWRIMSTEMSVSDHHYYAMLIKSAKSAAGDE